MPQGREPRTPEAAMSSAAAQTRYTPAQYLALERKAEYKSEYSDGVITAMSGASRAHNLVAASILREIGTRLKGKPCEAYVGDMRVRLGPSPRYTYPDIVVACGEPRFEDDVLDTLTNPTLIVEILSPSTESYDRGRKFEQYRRIASLREYVLVAQDRILIERYTRQGEEWVLTDFRSREDVLGLASIDCEVPLAEIYDRVSVLEEGDPAGDGPLNGPTGPAQATS
jgi:Uma2 family endonuclease